MHMTIYNGYNRLYSHISTMFISNDNVCHLFTPISKFFSYIEVPYIQQIHLAKILYQIKIPISKYRFMSKTDFMSKKEFMPKYVFMTKYTFISRYMPMTKLYVWTLYV